MMDFLVRETRAVIDGEMAIARCAAGTGAHACAWEPTQRHARRRAGSGAAAG